MKTLFQVLLALSLLAQSPAYADSPGGAREHASGKSRQNKDRKVFGAYVARKMADAFDGKLAAMYPCGTKPANYCQGLMVTAFETDTAYWMDPKTDKIAFTYFRQDIATPLYGKAGLVLWPQAYLDHDFPMVGQDHQSFKPVYRCVFPTDGDSNSRSDTGCGARVYYRGGAIPDTAPCATLGITTGRQWVDKYQGVAWNICGFGLNPADGSDRRGMQAMIDAAVILQKTGVQQQYPWNEVVMAPWPSYAPGRIPLMAFFWLPDPGAQTGTSRQRTASQTYQFLTAAQQQQKRYYDLAKIFVPIIQISQANANATFTYVDGDQAAGIPAIVTTMPQ